jgi:hypothetical protein
MKSGLDWTRFGSSAPVAFPFTRPIANLIEEPTQDVAISIIKIFYKDLATILAQSDSWGWGAALDLASYRELFVVDQETGYYKAFLAVIDFFTAFARDRFQETVKFTFDRRIQSSHNAAQLYALMQTA